MTYQQLFCVAIIFCFTGKQSKFQFFVFLQGIINTVQKGYLELQADNDVIFSPVKLGNRWQEQC